MAQALYRGGARDINTRKAYRDSFGDLPGKTIYADPLGKATGHAFDERMHMAKNLEPVYRAIDEIMEDDSASFRAASSQVAKALGVDDLTLPVFPREDLVNLAVRRTPLFEALPKVTSETITVDQDSVTGLGEAEFGGEADVPDDDADDDFTPQSLDMSYWRIRGSVTGPMQLASATLRNAMGGEQERKAMSMRQFAENAVLNGDPTGGNTDGGMEDERGFEGIRSILIDEGQNRDPAAGVGTTITIEEVRENQRIAAEDGGDQGSLLNVTDLKTLTDLLNETDDYDPLTINHNGTPEALELGGRGVRVDGVDIVVSDFMPNEADNREFLTVDMRLVSFHNLSDLVMESLGKTQDSDDFFMKQYGVFELAAGGADYCSLLQNLD